MNNSQLGNVLIIVVGEQGLDVKSEIRHISELKQSTVLYDPSMKDIYEACKALYQVVYFGCHHTLGEGLVLSHDEIMRREDVARVLRMSHAECVFFSSCDTQALSAYLVAHGAKYCIRTNMQIDDLDAWTTVLAFFRSLYNGARGNVAAAFLEADSGEGKYGLDISPDYIVEVGAKSVALAAKVATFTNEEQFHISTRLVTVMGVSSASILIFLLLLVGYLSGN